MSLGQPSAWHPKETNESQQKKPDVCLMKGAFQQSRHMCSGHPSSSTELQSRWSASSEIINGNGDPLAERRHFLLTRSAAGLAFSVLSIVLLYAILLVHLPEEHSRNSVNSDIFTDLSTLRRDDFCFVLSDVPLHSSSVRRLAKTKLQ